MSLVEHVKNICEERLDKVARTIEGELKAECPVGATGQARASIHVEQLDEWTRFVGGTNDHLFFADQGNNQRTGTIYPVSAQALKFTDGTFHARASTYEGKHFVKAVADRHR